MSTPRRLLTLLTLLALGASSGCDEEPTEPAVEGPLPLFSGTWYAHVAADSALPSTVARRQVFIVEERTVLDSAQIEIRSSKTYRQRYWVRVFVAEQLDRSETVLDEGTWRRSGSAYEFSSNVRERVMEVRTSGFSEISVRESYVTYADAPVVRTVYRTRRP